MPKEVKCNKTDFIGIYEDVYTAEECKQLREYIDLLEERTIICEEHPNYTHSVDHHSSNLIHHYDLPSWNWITRQISPRIQTCAQHYINSFSVLNRERFVFYDFKVKKIPEGGGFHKWHFEDSGINYAIRYIAVQIYLNADFEGGETEFLYFNKRVKPKEGMITIFPCAFTHTHRGNPPIGGTKYLATTWGIIQNSKPGSY